MKRVNLILVAVLAILGAAVYSYSQPAPGSGTIMYGQNNPAASPTLAPGGSYPLRVDPFGNLILSNNGGGGSVSPGTNAFFASPDNIYPIGTGNIWFADANNGSDSNNCKSAGAACLTITHALSLAGNNTNDVILIAPGFYIEDVVVSKGLVSLLAQRLAFPGGPAGIAETTFIFSNAGTALTVSGVTGVYLSGLSFLTGGSLPAVDVVDSANVSITNCEVNQGQSASDIRFHATSGNSQVNLAVTNSLIENAVNGVEFKGDAGSLGMGEPLIRGNNFVGNTGPDIVCDSGCLVNKITIDNNAFGDVDKAVYISGAAGADPTWHVVNNSFGVTTGNLTRAQITLPTGNPYLQQASPHGETGSSLSSTTNTLISSHITTAAAQNIFTASGDIDITDIALTTDATGLAGGTNFVLSTDNTSGALTLCSQAVSGLGANVSIKCSAAGTTTLKPFRLLSGKHILATCSVGNCTGAGTITVTPIATRASVYASFTNVALP